MVVKFTNSRIHVFSSPDPQFTSDEVPPHFSAQARLTVGKQHAETGSLTITNRRIVFVPSGNGHAFSFDFKAMVMHAVTAEKNIFIQLIEDEEDEDPEQDVIEIFPENIEDLNPLFAAINEMSALNPDDDDDQSVSEEDDQEEYTDS